ncbi:MAG: hypothetical protein M3R36_06630 [Bacteroidota bacterium]|nr:hypothetical protein [Bacteroidota bacterium]
MKSVILNYATFLFLLFIIGCSSSQSSIYKPNDGGTGWKINVTKKASISDEFICTVNDSVVVKASFPFIGDNFEKTGTYRGKKVLMNGYRNSNSTTNSKGEVQTNTTYQIRVFIDDVQVDKFDF